jgi:hypothetical protein
MIAMEYRLCRDTFRTLNPPSMKKLLMTILSAGLLAFGGTTVFAQTKKEERKAKKAQPSSQMTASSETAPKSVIHIVTVNFKSDATPQQIQAAIDGAHKLPTQFKGITRVWTKPIKNQTEMAHIIVMEFASEQALKEYAGSDAQKEWYKVYEEIRERSVTSDVTN